MPHKKTLQIYPSEVELGNILSMNILSQCTAKLCCCIILNFKDSGSMAGIVVEHVVKGL